VEAKLTLSTSKTYYNGELIKVVHPSNHRIKPVCAHFEACGGCALMHVNLKSADQIKIDLVKQALNKYAHINPPISFESNPHPFAYRNQCKFVLGENPKGLIVGCFQSIPMLLSLLPHVMSMRKMLSLQESKLLNCFKSTKHRSLHASNRKGLETLSFAPFNIKPWLLW